MIYNVLNLVGVGSYLEGNYRKSDLRDAEMLNANQDLAVDPETCTKEPCLNSCLDSKCNLCMQCLSKRDKFEISIAFKEHMNRGNMERIFPPAFVRVKKLNFYMVNYFFNSRSNQAILLTTL